MKNNKIKIVLLLILCLGIGFATLSAALNINGTITFEKQTFKVQFKFDSNDIAALNYFDQTGDTSFEFYNSYQQEINEERRFYFEIANTGTIDAMVSSVRVTQSEIFDIKFYYRDTMEEIQKYDSIGAGTTIPVVLITKFNSDLTKETMPKTDGNELMDVELLFEMANENVVYKGLDGINFDYTGTTEEYSTEKKGLYKLEVWGAQGASNWNNDPLNTFGGYGAYTTANVRLNKGDVLYVTPGQEGQIGEHPLNPDGDMISFLGGGASYITKEAGLLPTFENKQNKLLIVSGGGGGNDFCPGYVPSAGGIVGNPGYNIEVTGGTQTSGGTGINNGIFGIGGAAPYDNDDIGAAGGDGYYGGGSGVNTFDCGAGGSSFFNSKETSDGEMYCYDCQESSDASTKTISIKNVSEKAVSKYAKQGNGYVRISYIGK